MKNDDVRELEQSEEDTVKTIELSLIIVISVCAFAVILAAILTVIICKKKKSKKQEMIARKVDIPV